MKNLTKVLAVAVIAAMAEKIASGEFKPMDKTGKGMRAFPKKAPKLNAETTEVAE